MQSTHPNQESIDALVRRISDLNEPSLQQLSQYISYLKWQEELWNHLLDEESSSAAEQPLRWQFDFLEHFAAARQTAGIRDGALMEEDNLCAFHIYLNGARIWSKTKQSSDWERFLIDLPSLSGQEIIIQFVTDALGNSRWNWAVISKQRERRKSHKPIS